MKRVLFVSAAVSLAACSALPPQRPAATSAAAPSTPPAPLAAASAPSTPRAEANVGATILPGRRQGALPPSPPTRTPRAGDVSLNFPAVDVQAVAKAVLGDILHLPYSLAPDLHTPVTLQPGRKIARADVLPTFEAALRASGLALVAQPSGGYTILPVDQARAVAPVGAAEAVGFASEAIHLNFVNADALRRLIDPVLPGVVTATDPAAGVITIAGTEGQRAAARDLVREFDVDWLRGASFALFTPRRTDARLIVPELDKVLNADGAPTKNLVRLIAMDRLNGILAVSTQPQYLEDVRRWVDILDREGENNRRRLFVYRVQNGRAGDLAAVLANVFGQGGAGVKPARPSFDNPARPPGVIGVLPTDAAQGSTSTTSNGLGSGGVGSGGLGGSTTVAGGTLSGEGAGGVAGMNASGGGSGAPSGATVDVQADDFHARITSDEVNNALVVYATPRDYAVIEDALRKLDVAPYQVMIEAAIAEVTLTDQLRFGVQGLYQNHGLSVGLTENAAAATPVQDFPGFSAFYAAKTVTAALNALEGLTKVKVVSAPKLTVLNNQTASIEVGNEVPILTGSATSVITANAPVVNSVDYRDTGIILKVTPRVNSSGFVLLDLAQEVSDEVNPGSAATIASPSFSTRKIATSVAVQDGEVIALGGLIRDNRTDANNGLPVLSRIPVLGPLLFGNINNNDSRTELVVLLKPTVIHNVDDGRAVTDEIRDKLKSLRELLPPGSLP